MTNIFDRSARFNLNVVMMETNIKADTLRAWERRYGLPQPQRTEGGHRLYSQYDIETIRWLLDRQKEGMRIKQAVAYWNSIIEQKKNPLNIEEKEGEGADLPLVGENLDEVRREWLEACLNFDEKRADQILTQGFAIYPLETVCIEVLQKGVSEIGALWYRGEATVQQEHFTSALATRRMDVLIASAAAPILPGTVLLGCPETEQHSFSSLLLCFLLRNRGWQVVYLGANVPLPQLDETMGVVEPDLVVMTAMHLSSAAMLFEIGKSLKNKKVDLAYGGLIFSTNPEIISNIYGTYLGDDLLKAVKVIENLLKGAKPEIEHYEEIPDYSETRTQFIAQKALIEKGVMRNFNKISDPGMNDFIRDANDFLANDISAAFSLGNLDYVLPNISWLQGLLKERNLPDSLFKQYIAVYYEAVVENLDKSGEPLISWLKTLQ